MNNRKWLLKSRPVDTVGRHNFKYVVEDDWTSSRTSGQVCVQWELLLCAPTIRNWISGQRDSFYPVVEIGQAVSAPGIGTVVQSMNSDFPVGTRLFGFGSSQDYQWVDPCAGYRQIPDDIASVDAMGVLGINALTAYCGLMRIGEPKQSDVLLVSGAAGSVGSVVAQIGRILGCHVVGIAGGAEKLCWLREDCGIEHLIDYRCENVAKRIEALCPEGVDIYFDNVGGDILLAASRQMKPHGRIVLCGQISGYNSGGIIEAPPIDMMRMIYGGLRMEGFVSRHHSDHFPKALEELGAWNARGLLAHREDVRAGFDRLPETFSLLFSGGNQGTLLARISDGKGEQI